MHSLQLGPFAVSLQLALILLGVGAALIVGAIAARGRQVPIVDSLLSLALIGFVVARAAFVLQYLPDYMIDPWTIIDIRDGGFNAQAGLAGLLVIALWMFWRRPPARMPLVAALIAGGLGYGIASTLIAPPNQASSLPDTPLQTRQGETTNLIELARAHPGQPVVVNLWASWCPPCRREMPLLAKAQKQYDHITFVFANQGETAKDIESFLQHESLTLDHVLLDPHNRLAQATGTHAYPTTLFFNADGQLVNQHMGMLSAATLSRALQPITE